MHTRYGISIWRASVYNDGISNESQQGENDFDDWWAWIYWWLTKYEWQTLILRLGKEF